MQDKRKLLKKFLKAKGLERVTVTKARNGLIKIILETKLPKDKAFEFLREMVDEYGVSNMQIYYRHKE